MENENTIAIKFWCEFFTWGDANFSLEAAVDLWGRVEFSSEKKSKTLWMGEEVQEIYENNSILRSSSTLYKSIISISSYFKRLVPLHLTPTQCENSF